MKKSKKKPPTKKQKLMILLGGIVFAGIIIVVINLFSYTEPTWKYAQSFENDRYMVCVEKGYKQYKTNREDFFTIHIYDFQTNDYQDQLKIPIPDGQENRSEYLGYSNRYVWLKAPDLMVVDMLSKDKKMLDFVAVKKLICAKNPEFRDVIEIGKAEDHLKVTNQEGDEYYLNLETFATSKNPPKPYYSYHKEYTILEELPKTFNGDEYATEKDYSITIDKTTYLFHEVGDNHSLKFSFYSRPANGPEKITVTVTDATQAFIQDGAEFQPIPQTQIEVVKETSLTSKSFLNAFAFGVSNNRFVFRYQKTVGSTSPWYLAWFDLKTNSIVKEINLETKGIKIETQSEYLTSWVSIDGKWAFFGIQDKVPVRIRM